MQWVVGDFQSFKDEVSRVKREFTGTVDLSVKGYPMFMVGFSDLFLADSS